LAPCSPSYAPGANDFALGYVHAYVYVHEHVPQHPLDPSKTQKTVKADADAPFPDLQPLFLSLSILGLSIMSG
jgi:hypothetical protein